MQIFKRGIAVILTAVMLVGMNGSALSAFASQVDSSQMQSSGDDSSEENIESGEIGDNAEYTLTADGTLTITGTGELSKLPFNSEKQKTISAVVIGDGITSLPYNCFYGYYNKLETVSLPDSLSSLGSRAFSDCRNLKKIVLPNKITEIPYACFNGCYSLETVELGDQITTFSDEAFKNCQALKSIEIPSKATYIGSYAFYGCSSLKEIVIPDSLTQISYSCFYGCSSLTSVEFGSGISYIEQRAFYDCSALTEIKIPEKVTQIPYYCFSDCTSLASVDLGKNITEIGKEAFEGCTSLKTIELPDSINSIYISEDSIPFDEGTAIKAKTGSYAYFFAKGNGYDFISTGKIEFKGTFNETVTYTFDDEKNVLTFGGSGFIGDEENPDYSFDRPWEIVSNVAEEIVLGDKITGMGSYCFANFSKLKKINLSDKIKTIYSGVFYGCSSLEKLTFGEDVEVKDEAFKNCENLTVYAVTGSSAWFSAAKSDVKIVSTGVVDTVYSGYGGTMDFKAETLTISGEGSTGYYGYFERGDQARASWDVFATCTKKLIISEGTTKIEEGSFYFFNDLEEVQLPDSLTYIAPNYAFCGNPKFTVKCKTGSAGSFFAAANNLTFISTGELNPSGNVNDNISYSYDLKTKTLNISGEGEFSYDYDDGIPWEMFKSDIVSVVIEGEIINIPQEAFSGCTSLTSVSIPDTVTEISYEAFAGCSSLQTIALPDKLEQIYNRAFYGCTKLKEIEIPDSVWAIGENGLESSTVIKAKSGTPANGYALLNKMSFVSTGKTNYQLTLKDGAVKCSLDLDKKALTISGEGYLYYSSYEAIPWALLAPFAESVTIEDGIESVEPNDFKNFYKLKVLSLPDSVQYFSGSFDNCPELVEIYLGNNMEYISSSVFEGREELGVFCYSNTKTANLLSEFEGLNVYYIDGTDIIISLAYLSTDKVTIKWNPIKSQNPEDEVTCYRVYGDGKLLTETTNLTFTEEGLSEYASRDYSVSYVEKIGGESQKYTLKVYPAECTITKIEFADAKYKDGVLGGSLGSEPKPVFIDSVISGFETDPSEGNVRINAYVNNKFFMNGASVSFELSSDKKEWTELKSDIDAYSSYGEYSTVINASQLKNGTYYIRFNIQPQRGNKTSMIYEFQVDKTPPDYVTGLKAVGNSSSIYLYWDMAPQAKALGYYIFKKRSGTENYRLLTKITSRDDTSYKDTDVSEESLYQYFVVAYDKYDFYQTGFDEKYLARGRKTEDTEPPRVFSVTPRSGSVISGEQEFKIVASDDVQVETIELYYSEDKENWTLAASGKGSDFTPKVDTAKFPPNVYFKAKAIDTTGNESEFTNIYEYTVDNIGPEQVTGVTAESITVSSALMKWDEVTDEDVAYFELEQKINGEFVKVASSITTLGYNLNGLEDDTEYTYRVLAYDFFGNRGVESEEISFKTQKDTEPPEILRFLPLQNSKANNKINFFATVTDNSSVDKLVLYYSIDKELWTEINNNCNRKWQIQYNKF